MAMLVWGIFIASATPAVAQEPESGSDGESAESSESTAATEEAASSKTDDVSSAGDDEGTTATVSDEQRALNDEGVQMMLAGQHSRAVTTLEKALELGELNITYLNLGRAYQKLGNCVEARENLLAVFSAPSAAEPAPDVVDKKAQQYLRQLKQNCVFPEEQRERRRTMGWWLTGGGGVMALGGAALYVFGAVQPRNELRDAQTDSFGVYKDLEQEEAFAKRDRADVFAVAGISTMAVGLVGVGMGTYYLLANREPEGKPSAMIAPDGSFRVGWTWRF